MDSSKVVVQDIDFDDEVGLGFAGVDGAVVLGFDVGLGLTVGSVDAGAAVGLVSFAVEEASALD